MKKTRTVKLKKTNTDAILKTETDPDFGVVFRPKNRTTKMGYAQCVPHFGGPLFGPDTVLEFGAQNF